MPATAQEAYPVEKIRWELRLPANSSVDASISAHVESAVAYIQRVTGYPIVDDEVRRTLQVSGFPFQVRGQFMDSIAEFLKFMSDGRPAAVAGTSIRRIGDQVYLVDGPADTIRNQRVMLRIKRTMEAEDIPSAFFQSVVMMCRDGFDGIPRASTERAVNSILKPWMW